MKSVSLLGLCLFSQFAWADFSGIWEQELAIGRNGNGQKFEAILEPEWQLDLSDNVSMTLIARARFDSLDRLGSSLNSNDESYSRANRLFIDGSHGEVGITEWYLDTEISGTYWRIGKQQLVWGQADGLKVLDAINPQSFREFILDDFDNSRIPLWMANIDIPINENASVQFLWVPDQTYHEFAETGALYQSTRAQTIPEQPEGRSLAGFNLNKPGRVFRDSDVGVRYSSFTSGWDLTLNYLYHYQDSPVFYQDVNDDQVVINAAYERSTLLGASASKSFGDFTWRAEFAHNTNTFHLLKPDLDDFIQRRGVFRSNELSSVVGLDWQGLSDTLISVQWFQSYVFDYEPSAIRPKQDHMASLLFQRTFSNEAWKIDALVLHGFEHKDWNAQITLSHFLTSNLQLRVGFDLFSGDTAGLLGQFRQTDRMTLGLEWGF